MARKYKCYGICGEKYESDIMIMHNNKRYCKKCYDEKIKDEDDRKTLYSLIRKSYKVTFPTSMHLAQIKRVKENGYTYDDMILALNYCNDVLRLNLTPNMGFGYVSNNIEAAKHHYEEQKNKNKNIDNIFLTDVAVCNKVVARKIDNTNEVLKSKMINLEDLL